jgi:hypothetical protein
VKTQTSTSEQRRTSAKPKTGEKPKPPKPAKPPKPEPLKYDFADSYRGNMCSLVNNATQKTKRRFLTLTEWPQSLVQAYDAGILTGESETVAQGMKAMSNLMFAKGANGTPES